MALTCTRCESSGFLNLDHVPDDVRKKFDETYDHQVFLSWMAETAKAVDELGGCSCHISTPCSTCMLWHEVTVCDCCGNGESWHGVPGEHNQTADGWDTVSWPACY